MVECPKSALDTIRRVYPMIADVKWNPRKACFEMFEEVYQDTCRRLRRIMDYRNPDGSALPFIGDRALDQLRRADTRLWPLAERMKLYDKEEEEEDARIERQIRDEVGTRIKEDYRYIAGIPTFFFGPDMKVARGGYLPTQEKILKATGNM